MQSCEKKRNVMYKEKAKHKETVLEYWWNEFLFRKKFSFETEVAPETCAETFRRMQTRKEGWWTEMWRRAKWETSVYSLDEERYSFQLVIKRRNRGAYLTSAQASGKISRDQRGATLVEGEARLGAISHVFILIAIFMIVFVFFGMNRYMMDEFPFLIFSLLIVGILGFTWWRLLDDRNKLIERIRFEVVREKAKR